MKYDLSYKVSKVRDQSSRDRKLGIVILLEERNFSLPILRCSHHGCMNLKGIACAHEKYNINNTTMSSVHTGLRQCPGFSIVAFNRVITVGKEDQFSYLSHTCSSLALE